MNKKALLILSIIGIAYSLSIKSYLMPDDRQHLKNVLASGWALSDLAQVFYAAGGYKHLNLEIPNKEKACNFIKSSIKEGASSETLYFGSSAGKILGCPVTAPASIKQILSDALRDDAPLQEVFYAISAASNLNVEVDSPKVVRAVQQTLKKDDSVLSLGYAFHIGALLKGERTAIFDRIEDAVVQADEVDGYMLQFEGGLSITALVLTGAYKLSESVNKPVPIKKDQVLKFVNYLMSRKSVQLPKGAYYLLEAISLLNSNKNHLPIVVTLASNVAVSIEAPVTQVRITDLVGNEVKQLQKVSAPSITEKSTDSVLASNILLNKVPKQPTVYELNMMKHKPNRGFYTLVLNVEGSDARMIGNSQVIMIVKVLSSIALEEVELGTADSDQSTAPNMKKLSHPTKLGEVIEADQHQRVILKFLILDSASKKPARVHQAFVKFTHLDSRREIIFIAEPDANDMYKFDMDVSGRKKEFGSMSGKYSLDLIVGDASINNPLIWSMADVVLSFPDSATHTTQKDYTYQARPEIHHLFREPDPRPPRIVSLAFTCLCLLPLLVLVIGWLKLGVNLSNFLFSFSTLGFHIGLGAIFALFCLFWLQLNMFATLRYLLMVGVITFFCGNSMLSKIAGKRKEKGSH